MTASPAAARFSASSALKAIRDGKTKYTPSDGIPELKEAVCAKFARENGLSYTPSQVNVSPGGKAVLFGDPKMDKDRKQVLIRAFAKALRTEDDYIFGPDMGTDEAMSCAVCVEATRVR